ncbi:MAG: hypothetical protein JNJ40_12730 [Bacteroidia bacterium]|nr:hypothetical protein [Bacteroidia bacterium]
MKKFVVIFLLFQITSSNAFAEELVKIPALLTHYIHHSQKHEDTGSFFDFLHKHYYNHHENDKHDDGKHEEDKDCKLPLKHCGGCCINVHAPMLGFVSSYLSADCTAISLEAVNFLPQQDSFQSLDISNIWQPPKISNIIG